MTSAIISSNAHGDPEIGDEIPTVLKQVTTYKRRAVVGWNHQNDTPNGLQSGKVWGWVSEHDHFCVYDESFNRSLEAGDVRFCGVANFTMYRQLIRKWRISQDLPVDDDLQNPIQPRQTGNRRGRPARRSRGGRALRGGRGRGRGRPRASRSRIREGEDKASRDQNRDDVIAISDDDDDDGGSDTELLNSMRRDRAAAGNVQNNDGLFTSPSAEEVKTEARSASVRFDRGSSARDRSVETPTLNSNRPDLTDNQDEGEEITPTTGTTDSLVGNDAMDYPLVEDDTRPVDTNEVTQQGMTPLPSSMATTVVGSAASTVEDASFPPLPGLTGEEKSMREVIDLTRFLVGERMEPIVIDDD
ncbi:hypothetical protein LTS08_005998 [Lithohypha guttulata]|uniref:uncharacterized protein n=1 Tax=Lithohypha guttulata TaxID=1690604 RepID=UPI002DDF5668|nr:hypothetical protein LTR51_002512 [Lithohypha guttulata]KAK5099416.1 hypothetical protein LTS08_005998 [Lithohypha guttulata]